MELALAAELPELGVEEGPHIIYRVQSTDCSD